MEYTEAHEPHHDQVVVWSDDLTEALQPWLKDFESYDDKLRFFEALHDEIAGIAISAHAAGMLRQRNQK